MGVLKVQDPPGSGIWVPVVSSGGGGGGGSNVPVGTILAWSTTTAPTGYLICDGKAVSRGTYSDLFAVIGTTYGVGDGTTTFNLPNLQSRVPVGKDIAGTDFITQGQVGGEAKHLLTTAEIPNLTLRSADGYQIMNGLGGGTAGYYLQNTNNTGNNKAAYALAGGSGAAHNNIQPYLVVTYVIRATATAGTDTATTQYFKGSVPVNTSVTLTGGANWALATRTDPANAWNATNNNWVVPVAGRYRITAAYKHDSATTQSSLYIVKNGSNIAASAAPAASGFAGVLIADVFDLVAGDTIAARVSSTVTTVADGAGIENTYLIIESVGLAGVLPSGHWEAVNGVGGSFGGAAWTAICNLPLTGCPVGAVVSVQTVTSLSAATATGQMRSRLTSAGATFSPNLGGSGPMANQGTANTWSALHLTSIVTLTAAAPTIALEGYVNTGTCSVDPLTHMTAVRIA